jgi:hypothetical protein
MASKNPTQSNVTTSTSPATGSTAAPKKTPARKPAVIDRIAINALAIPAAPASPAPTAAPSPAAAPAPAASPAQPPVATAAPAAPAADPSPTPSASSDDGGGADFPVAMPPDVTVPSVPAGFVPVNPLDLRGWRPMQSELASLPDAVMELNGFANYAEVFGITAPPASQVSTRLTVAAAWTTLYASTTAWYNYVKSLEGMAWKDALELFDKLKVPFQLAAASNPAMLNQYPAIARMTEAKGLAAKRGTSTKAKDKKAAAKATAAQAAAAAAPQTGAAAQAVAAAPARVVTVQG